MPTAVNSKTHTVEFAGQIDENTNFDSIPSTLDPLYVDFQKTININSIGCANFLAWIETWGSRDIRYYNVPFIVLDSFTILPALVGQEKHPAKLCSFELEFDCSKCNKAVYVYVKAEALFIKAGEICIPDQLCPKCKSPASCNDLSDRVELERLVERGALAISAKA